MPALDTARSLAMRFAEADAESADLLAREVHKARPVMTRGYCPTDDVLVIQRDTGFVVIPPTRGSATPVECDDWDEAHDAIRDCLSDLVGYYRGEAGRVFTLAEGDVGFREQSNDENGKYDEPTSRVRS